MVALGLAADPAFPTLNVEQNAFSDLIASQNNHRTPQLHGHSNHVRTPTF